MTTVDGDIGGGIVWVYDWEGFANALVATANAAATAVVAVAIPAADELTTATSQPLHENKTAALLYSHQGRTDKKDRNELCGGRRDMTLLPQTSKVGGIILAWGGSWDVFLYPQEDRGFKSPREEPT
jgi:hypothetical protein